DEVVVAPDRLEELAPGGGAYLCGGLGPRDLAIRLESQIAGERREEDHEPPLYLGPVARGERGARAVLEARRQGGGVGTHLRAERTRVEQLERNVVLLGLHRELDLLEVRRDRVVPGNVGADMMRSDGTGYCSECREHGQDRGWPEKDASRLRTPVLARHDLIIRRATIPTRHQSATIVAVPNGTKRSHSAIAFDRSSPYDGISALHRR